MSTELFVNYLMNETINIQDLIHTYNIELSLTLRFVSLFISLLSFILGFQAYQRYIANKALEKQLEAVIELVAKIENLRFQISIINSEYLSSSFSSDFNIFSAIFDEYRIWGKKPIVYTYEVVDKIFCEIYNLHKDILLPKPIVESLMEFNHFLNCRSLPSNTLEELTKLYLIQYPFIYISEVGQGFSEKNIFILSMKDIQYMRSDKLIQSILIKLIPSTYKHGFGLSNISTFYKKLDGIADSISNWLRKKGIREVYIKRKTKTYGILKTTLRNDTVMELETNLHQKKGE
jgi:hypothetical protein